MAELLEPDLSSTCHYAVLGVTPGADSDTIRRAYKTLALIHHPDKGGAPGTFNKLKAAFSILSDDKARALYDVQRAHGAAGNDDIARRFGPVSALEFSLLPFMDAGAFDGYDDGASPWSFYRVYGYVFARLAEQERAALEEEGDTDAELLPPFGDATFKPEDVSRFYRVWRAFSTVKRYKHIAADEELFEMLGLNGAGRKTRRMMENFCRRERRNASAYHSVTVRELADWLRSFDPRVVRELRPQAPTSCSFPGCDTANRATPCARGCGKAAYCCMTHAKRDFGRHKANCLAAAKKSNPGQPAPSTPPAG